RHRVPREDARPAEPVPASTPTGRRRRWAEDAELTRAVPAPGRGLVWPPTNSSHPDGDGRARGHLGAADPVRVSQGMDLQLHVDPADVAYLNGSPDRSATERP